MKGARQKLNGFYMVGYFMFALMFAWALDLWWMALLVSIALLAAGLNSGAVRLDSAPNHHKRK